MNKKEYIKKNEEFLINLKNEDCIKELRGGILYKVLESGNGEGEVKPRSIVTCHYKGSLINGKVFDNSFSRKCPEAFRVNDLISGFQIALINMHIGDHWIVYIPAEMGYGSRNSGDIPGNSTLIFEIKLISIG
ncbi:MAG: FKBP-type peptidyl-prolyl cis-trans isomerase [Bacteroidaceae bacterium]|nr:FKBP-type peptidyl-prolyl cis-trans isomerase [Bacteroidaceae bacterium]